MIYALPQLYKAVILARPSKVCKSPYLADISVYDPNDPSSILEECVMAHTPALGCCGLIAPGTIVYCTKSESTKNKSKYVIHHVAGENGEIIGVNPMLANPIVKSLLLSGTIGMYSNLKSDVSANLLLQSKALGVKEEVVVGDSRFDFSFTTESGKLVYCEVKNVPLADVVDVPAKERKKMDLSSYDFSKKIAIFPDGYRKSKSEPVSERALKHVNHLREIHTTHPEIECVLIFLIQRSDVDAFKPSSLDPIYQKAVYDAMESGVHVLPLCVEWKGNECFFLKSVNVL